MPRIKKRTTFLGIKIWSGAHVVQNYSAHGRECSYDLSSFLILLQKLLLRQSYCDTSLIFLAYKIVAPVSHRKFGGMNHFFELACRFIGKILEGEKVAGTVSTRLLHNSVCSVPDRISELSMPLHTRMPLLM